LQVVVTVAKADAVLQGHAQIVTYRLDAAPFIKPTVDELSVHIAAIQTVQLALTEHESVLVQALRLVQILAALRDIHDLIQRLALIIGQRADGHAVLHGLAPTGGFAVQIACIPVGKTPALDHLQAAVGGVPRFQRALHAVALHGVAHTLCQLRLHGQVYQHLVPAEHITASTAYCAVKAVVQQWLGHAQVASGAQKQLVAVGVRLAQRFHRALGDQHLARGQQSAVDI